MSQGSEKMRTDVINLCCDYSRIMGFSHKGKYEKYEQNEDGEQLHKHILCRYRRSHVLHACIESLEFYVKELQRKHFCACLNG